MTRRKRYALLLVTVAIFVSGFALAAFGATTCVTTSGSRGCWASTDNKISAQDTAVNGNEVYTAYCLTNNAGQSSCSSPTSLYNSGDKLDTVTAIVPVGSYARIVFRSCQAVPIFPDVCSSWTNTAT